MPTYVAELSIVDQIMPAALTPMWMTFATPDPDGAVATLKQGIDKTINQLPFLSGEVFEDAADKFKGKLMWSDDKPQIPFPEVLRPELPSYEELASTGMAFHKLNLEFRPPLLINTMMSERKPTFVASYTKLRGGLIVLFAVHHFVVDGGGMALLFNTIARNTQGASTSDYPIDPLEPLKRIPLLQVALEKLAPEASKYMDDAISKAPENEDRVTVTHEPPMDAPTKMLEFSVARLEALRLAISKHTKTKFTLNTMLSAILWSMAGIARWQRLRASEATNKPGLESYMLLAVNPRKMFEKDSAIEKKNSWLGNLATGISPTPHVPYERFDSEDAVELEFECPPAVERDNHKVDGVNGVNGINGANGANGVKSSSTVRVSCPTVILELIEMLSTGLTTISSGRVAAEQELQLRRAAAPGFNDYRQLRTMTSVFNGLDYCVTNWAALDLLPDYGPGLGRPEYPRLTSSIGFDGVTIMLPRHRGADVRPDLLDRLDAITMLRRDDMEVLEKCPIINAVLRAPMA